MDTLDNLRSETIGHKVKLVMFLFSITTISIGYAIQSTKNLTPEWTSLIWLLSIGLMGASFFYGLQSMLNLFNSSSSLMLILGCQNYIRNSCFDCVKNTIRQKALSENKTTPSSIDENIVQNLFLQIKKEAGETPLIQYINAMKVDELRMLLHKELYVLFGKKSEDDEVKKGLALESETDNGFKRQRRYLLAGFVAYFLFHVSTFNWNVTPIEATPPEISSTTPAVSGLSENSVLPVPEVLPAHSYASMHKNSTPE